MWDIAMRPMILARAGFVLLVLLFLLFQWLLRFIEVISLLHRFAEIFGQHFVLFSLFRRQIVPFLRSCLCKL